MIHYMQLNNYTALIISDLDAISEDNECHDECEESEVPIDDHSELMVTRGGRRRKRPAWMDRGEFVLK